MAKRIFYTLLDDLALLKKLLNEDSNRENLWKEFIRRFTKLILKICWKYEKDKDRVMDKYLWVCTRLYDNDFAILRKFNDGQRKIKPKFTTWLVSVISNLCIDEFRSVHGRRYYPKALLTLDQIHRKVFELYFWQRLTEEEIESAASIGRETINEILSDIEDLLNSTRESISFNYQNPVFAYLNGEDIPSSGDEDNSFDLEVLAERWLSRLPEEDKIIIRLKFWEGLSAKEIASILNIKNEQKVYTTLRNILNTLKKEAKKDLSD